VDAGLTTVSNIVLKSNRASCTGTECVVDETGDFFGDELSVSGITGTANRANCFGDFCEVGPQFFFDAESGSHVVSGLNLKANKSGCEGTECYVYGMALFYGDSEIKSTRVTCRGDLCVAGPIVYIDGTADGDVSTLTNVSVLASKCYCYAFTCQGPPACGLFNVTAGGGLAVTDSTFEKNKGDLPGGAIGNGGSGVLSISGTTIARNSAYLGGGGINNIGSLTIDTSTITKNKTKGDGGGIWNMGTIVSITDTVLESNKPQDCLDDGGTGCP
jgi:hypothetical protein